MEGFHDFYCPHLLLAYSFSRVPTCATVDKIGYHQNEGPQNRLAIAKPVSWSGKFEMTTFGL